MIRENLRKYGTGLTRDAHFTPTGVATTALDASLTWDHVRLGSLAHKVATAPQRHPGAEDARLPWRTGPTASSFPTRSTQPRQTLSTLEALPGVVDSSRRQDSVLVRRRHPSGHGHFQSARAGCNRGGNRAPIRLRLDGCGVGRSRSRNRITSLGTPRRNGALWTPDNRFHRQSVLWNHLSV